jgi:CheY-like chemotaxis protein
MPIMDGFEATRHIRSLEKERGLPAAETANIIALTALASNSDRDKAFDAGVNMFLTKPVQFSKLLAVLKEYKEKSTQ